MRIKGVASECGQTVSRVHIFLDLSANPYVYRESLKHIKVCFLERRTVARQSAGDEEAEVIGADGQRERLVGRAMLAR